MQDGSVDSGEKKEFDYHAFCAEIKALLPIDRKNLDASFERILDATVAALLVTSGNETVLYTLHVAIDEKVGVESTNIGDGSGEIPFAIQRARESLYANVLLRLICRLTSPAAKQDQSLPDTGTCDRAQGVLSE